MSVKNNHGAATKYYHCVSRCIRRAFLCGEDCFTGKSYEHRRGGEGKLLALVAKTFCIYVCAYAVMNNQQNVATLTTAKNYWPVLIPS
ncbi:transposase [Pseudoalteromonas neustonica]|uniref:Transposase n=1 Tax=Pseudoalteromonas neustonica TaxID=1840331 RepID=A0ABY3FJ73_9GAMM|nr:transposase [Pseudoalteromonas neustonica]